MGKKAPPELYEIGLDAGVFIKSDRKSWRGPCPKCGGTRRFVVFTDKPWPHWWGMCDGCGLQGWANQINPNLKTQVDPLDVAMQRSQYDQEQTVRDEYRKSKLAEFSTSEIYAELHSRMTEENREWWHDKAGIPAPWQDYWKLGYVPSRKFEFDGEFYERPAYSIPKFGLDWQLLNIDYRLIDPPAGAGKYRPEVDLPQAVFLARPDFGSISEDGQIIVVEGSKKAMVTYCHQSNCPQVVGVPSCNSWAGIEEQLKELDRVYIILDPDAQAWAYRKAQAIGSSARIMTMPTKLDDAFMFYGLTEDVFKNLMKQALKI